MTLWRKIVPLAGLLTLSAAAVAQEGRTVRWQGEVQPAIAAAKKAHRPLMFYVTRASQMRDPDVERDQKRSFADERVVELSQRFVPVQLSASQHRDMLNQWKLPQDAYLYVVFSTPDGNMIDWIGSGGVANPDSFSQKMALVFRQYRRQMYEKELKSVLESEETADKDLREALKRVKDFIIPEADQSLAALAKREKLDEKLRQEVYSTLAVLSTKNSITLLFDRAKAGDEAAVKALDDCTPAAAETMLDWLDGDDEKLRLAAYQAVTKICKVKNVKSAKFWEGNNERLQKEEIQRVKKQVQSVARRWKERYEEYR